MDKYRTEAQHADDEIADQILHARAVQAGFPDADAHSGYLHAMDEEPEHVSLEDIESWRRVSRLAEPLHVQAYNEQQDNSQIGLTSVHVGTGKAILRQVGGEHYKQHKIQPWDIIDEYSLNYYEGNVLTYLLRRKGNRLQDLQKAAHYLEKEIENIKEDMI